MAFRIVIVRNARTLAMTESDYILPLHGYEGEKTTIYPADILEQMTAPVPASHTAKTDAKETP